MYECKALSDRNNHNIHLLSLEVVRRIFVEFVGDSYFDFTKLTKSYKQESSLVSSLIQLYIGYEHNQGKRRNTLNEIIKDHIENSTIGVVYEDIDPLNVSPMAIKVLTKIVLLWQIIPISKQPSLISFVGVH